MKILFLIAILFGAENLTYAQSVTVNPTPASCPGQGSATVSTVDITNPFFQLKDSEGVNIGSGNTSGIFLALDAGDYQVQVTGEGAYNQTFQFTVQDEYEAIPNPVINISGLCDATFTIGGEISVVMPASPAGKTYEYKVVKTNDPNFPESEGTYQPTSISTSITEFGTYQVRIKDECGQTITLQRDVEPTLQEIKGMYFGPLNTQACGSNIVEMGSIQFFSTESGGNLGFDAYLAAGGVKVEMWERPSGACPGEAPSTAPLFSEIITTVNDNTGYTLPLVPGLRYVVRVTTPCGQSNVFCMSLEGFTTPGLEVVSSNEGCGAAETMTISGSENFFLNFPVDVTVTNNSTGTVVYTGTENGSWFLDRWSVTGLPLDEYTVTYTDECGVSVSQIVNNPNPGTTTVPPSISDIEYTKWKCFDDLSGTLVETGTTQVTLTIDGYIPNRSGAEVVIVSGPSNVGVSGTLYSNIQYAWTNMLPGDYTIKVDSGCDGESPVFLNFTVDPAPSQILQQSLTSFGTSFCTGGGSINSNVVYNGAANNTIQLLDGSGNVLDSNTSGNFVNLVAGTYYTRIEIIKCNNDTYYIDNPNPIVITDGATGPQIVKKVGIVCEDATGTPTSTGSAYFEIAGASPIIVEYKLQSETVWNTFSTDSPMTFEIDNLTPNEIYDVKITSCGNSISTTVAIQTPGVLTATNTVQPCVDEPYTLSAPDYAGATYEWKNPAGVIVSTERNYNIVNYDSSMDGTYTATITWGDCVVRYITLNLNSQRCGEPIDDICTQDPNTEAPDGYTQVGVSTMKSQVNGWPENIANGWITLESKEKGFVITRVSQVGGGTDGAPAETDAIADPKEGMIVYDIAAECVKLFNGTVWNCIKRSCND